MLRTGIRIGRLCGTSLDDAQHLFRPLERLFPGKAFPVPFAPQRFGPRTVPNILWGWHGDVGVDQGCTAQTRAPNDDDIPTHVDLEHRGLPPQTPFAVGSDLREPAEQALRIVARPNLTTPLQHANRHLVII